MRKLIELPHKAFDYNCMLSGLEDLIALNTGVRLPEYFMFFGSCIGFQYTCCDGPVPRQVGGGAGVGPGQYQFLAEVFGFDWHSRQAQDFGAAWEAMRSLIDQGQPVVMGELDMFHLPYLKKFYHRIHVPIHYITLVGYDDKRHMALVQDCGRKETLDVPVGELEKALNIQPNRTCGPNTFYWFDFQERVDQGRSREQVMQQILRKRSRVYLLPPDDNQGSRALQRLIEDFPHWQEQMVLQQYKASLKHLVVHTCSMVPMPPQKLVFYPIEEQFKSHQAMRDRFAGLLRGLELNGSSAQCQQAADLFAQSGCLFQELTDGVTDYLAALVKTSRVKQGLGRVPQVLEEIAEIEAKAFALLGEV